MLNTDNNLAVVTTGCPNMHACIQMEQDCTLNQHHAHFFICMLTNSVFISQYISMIILNWHEWAWKWKPRKWGLWLTTCLFEQRSLPSKESRNSWPALRQGICCSFSFFERVIYTWQDGRRRGVYKPCSFCFLIQFKFSLF